LCAGLLCALSAAHAQEEFSLAGFKLPEFPAEGAPPILRLVSAGAEPRRELRYRFAAGSLHRFVMTMRMSVGVEVDGRDAPVQRAPAMRMTLDCRVAEVDERQARLEFSSGGPPEPFETEGVAPAMLEAVRKGLGPLSGMRGEISLTHRGVVRSSRVEFGQPLDQQAAPRQPMPGGAGGASVELASLQARGEGASVVDLRSPVPRSRVETDQTMRMSVQTQERTVRMGMRTRMQLQVEPSAAR